MSVIWYAGFGSRETPDPICNLMAGIASVLRTDGYCARSGGAPGADRAFEDGDHDTLVLRPRHATDEAIEVASRFHPAWHLCNDHARRLHGRNAMIMLGSDLNEPARFGVCWTYPGNTRGGTVLGMRICEGYGIEVRNLSDLVWLAWAKALVKVVG